MLNLSEIQVFTVASETKNFSQAARQVHLSQPAVSQQIRSLENYLGVQLFHRSGRGVALTDAGQALLPMARQLLSLAQQLEETIRSLEEQVAGSLVIGCTTTAGKYILPLIVAAFRQRYPKVHVTIEMCTDGPAKDLLIAQEVHIGISDTMIVQPSVECRPFFVDHIGLIVPADHPFAHQSCVQPSQLLDQPFILQEQKSSTRQMLERALAEQGITLDQMQVMMVVGSAEAIEAAVEYGLGIAFISRLAARHGLASGHLVQVPVAGIHLERPLYVARYSPSSKSGAHVRFWDFVGECRQEIARLLSSNPLCERCSGLFVSSLLPQPSAGPGESPAMDVSEPADTSPG
ncbi:MAG: LysR family transcriptional regulator [Anaerolineae bacterium]|nr:LysR family transcriptional regulator [Anaerolineae bacterium]